MPDRAEQLLAALLLEAAFGYPQALHRRVPHPIVWAGNLIAAMDRRWNRGIATRQRLAGIATAAILILVSGGLGLALEQILSGWTGATLLVLLATTGLAQKSLHDHVRAVARPLAAGNIDQARTALAMIVGRDVHALDEQGISAAATESLAESFCDGIVAPAFWFLVAGLPGLIAFKAISTADSLIGHLDERYRHFGWASARLDDLLNLIPARLSGLLLCIATAIKPSPQRRLGSISPSTNEGAGGEGDGSQPSLGRRASTWGDTRNALHIMLRDARNHLSPNAGWPEAAMAGALGVRLGGGTRYDGEWIARAELGDGPRPQAQDLSHALTLYRRACLLLWLLAGGLAWAL
jgi:adenosylcobinamide-phosphate synthase